jgi:hypothetical protein
METILTMYLATGSGADGERLQFDRVRAQPLPIWYSRFGHLKTIHQNEALLGTLIRAAEDGLSMAVGNDCTFLFVNGDFPASDMGVSVRPDRADLTDDGRGADALSELLSIRRIAYTPRRLHGFFIDGDGEILEPEDVHIRFQASTVEAVAAMAEQDPEECEKYFGEDIVSAASQSVDRQRLS